VNRACKQISDNPELLAWLCERFVEPARALSHLPVGERDKGELQCLTAHLVALAAQASLFLLLLR
jgi:hypothetical protein